MTQKGNIYTADEGKWFIRKSDSFKMGNSLDMGIYDSIENYDEVIYTEEEYNDFYKDRTFHKKFRNNK